MNGCFGPCRHSCFYSLEVVFIQPRLTEHPAHFYLTRLRTFLKWVPLYPTELMKERGWVRSPLHSAKRRVPPADWTAVNCMNVGDGKTGDSCINLFLLCRCILRCNVQRRPWISCWCRELYASVQMFCMCCFFPALRLLTQPVLQFISLIIKDFSALLAKNVRKPTQNISICLSFVPPGHHSIFRPRENLRAASPHDRKRSISQIPFPQAALFVPAQYGGCTGHTDQRFRPQPGGDPYRRPKPSQPQHPLL